MYKTVLNMTAAAAIGLSTLSAAPAQAGNDEALGKFIFGALSLMILAEALDKDQPKTLPKPPRKPDVVPTPPKRKVRFLPSECRRKIKKRHGGMTRFVSRKCLRRNMVDLAKLPKQCARKIETRHGNIRRGYNENCLTQRNFQFR